MKKQEEREEIKEILKRAVVGRLKIEGVPGVELLDVQYSGSLSNNPPPRATVFLKIDGKIYEGKAFEEDLPSAVAEATKRAIENWKGVNGPVGIFQNPGRKKPTKIGWGS